MKRSILISLAGLTLVAACTETLTRPADVADAVNGRLAPRGPLLDDIVNNLDATVDAAAEQMPLNAGGSNGTTQIYVMPTGGDGKNGCNFQGNEVLDVSVSSSNPSVATVSPASLRFGSCGDTKTLTIVPLAPGNVTISVAQASNNTGASFNFAPATFTVSVVAATPANGAPSIAVAGVTGGASYNKGSVPAATCQVTDVEDGNSSFPATLSAITGPYASDGIGSQTASCSYTDDGGLTASESETYSIVDPSAPAIDYTLNPASPNGTNGWYTGNVSLTWDVQETQSPNSLQKTGCADQNITADQVETTYSCSATSAGGSAGPTDVKIKRDGTAPTVAYTSAAPAANGAGWNNTDVVATFTATDNTSGFAGASTKTGTATSSGEGSSVLVSSPAFTDDAGNAVAAGAASASFKIDKTKPTSVAFVGNLVNGGSYYFSFVPAASTCTADDALSLLKDCVVTGYSSAIGTHTLTATATDNAGNVETASLTYTVLAWTLRGFYQPVDMGGVLNVVKAGSTVPLKFEIFAGSTELTTTTSVKSFYASPASCNTSAVTDEVEVTTTGGTTLRYDATEGQFIQNWQTPKTVGLCYRAVMTTQDNSQLSALFKLK